MTQWHFWNEKEFSDVYENIYIRSFVKDWFGIVNEIVKEVSLVKSDNKRILDIGCGEGHTTKQILDRIEGNYICDLLEPNKNALASAKIFLAIENNIGNAYNEILGSFNSEFKYDIIFTSHTNYYWATNKDDYDKQLQKITQWLKNNGKILILTLPKSSDHYKIMLKSIYPEFVYAEYIIDFYKKLGFEVKIKKFKMRMFIGDILTTKKLFDLKAFYRFIHNTESYPNDFESIEFMNKIKKYQKDNYIDFRDYLISIFK